MRIEQLAMNKATYLECKNICDEIVKARTGRGIKKRDYPAAIVACATSWQNYLDAKKARCGKVDRRSYSHTPELESALKSIGEIGGKRDGCNNFIGGCAEPHAAREVLKDDNKVKVNDLVFSYAYRPRTKCVIRYCRNCVDVFNVQNP